MTSFKILFVCIGNTCRSPLAEAITRAIGGDAVEPASAGIMPFGRVVEPTIATLEQLGYPADGLASKGLDAVDLDSFDVIVSLLGETGLQYLPRSLGAELLAWSIPDPYGEDDDVYFGVARLLERRINELLDRLRRGELLLD